eukprot:TRINITY_DN10099_c0_g1_i1.p1 TRINITY_DN10099_c0_g1~~TRINITY_DN10099_c0_g1_i1.p1  ORF type:complete len:379 (-),score=118.87 TRINITY_DN10099_c0_g1_i1:61-1197(-)
MMILRDSDTGTMLSIAPWKFHMGMCFMRGTLAGLDPPHTGAMAANMPGYALAMLQVPNPPIERPVRYMRDLSTRAPCSSRNPSSKALSLSDFQPYPEGPDWGLTQMKGKSSSSASSSMTLGMPCTLTFCSCSMPCFLVDSPAPCKKRIKGKGPTAPYTSTMKIILAFFALALLVAPTFAQNELECEGCTFLVGTIESWVAANHTEAQIIAELNALCKVVGKNEQAVCKQLLETGIPQIIQMIENKETPNAICISMSMCKKSMRPTNTIMITPLLANPLECEVCHVIVRAVDGWIQSNKTEEAIEQDLNRLCTFFLHESKDACQKIADTETHKLVEWIVNNETPEKACDKGQLNMCTSESREDIIGLMGARGDALDMKA